MASITYQQFAASQAILTAGEPQLFLSRPDTASPGRGRWSDSDLFDRLDLRAINVEMSAMMADEAPVALALINPHTGAILWINKNGRELLGLAQKDVIGGRLAQVVVHRQDRRRLAAEFRADGRLDGTEVLLRTVSGRRFRAAAWLRPVRVHGQALLVAGAIDIGCGKQPETNPALTHKRAEAAVEALRRRHAVRTASPSHALTMRATVDIATTLLEPEISRSGLRIEIDCDCDGDLDLERRHQVLARILSHLTRNSLMHAYLPGQGGRVRIFGRRRSATEIEVRHEDDGLGIQPEYLGKVFEPFFTTAFARGATGIGLTIVRTLVLKRLGGRIELESRPGRGTAVSLILPAPLHR
jgi:PAS domain S-box-containing protein